MFEFEKSMVTEKSVQNILQFNNEQSRNSIQRAEINSNQLATSAQKTTQIKKNETGLPDNLKSGIENLSGISMDDVKVHYNSSSPGTLQAHAYTQGSEIHVAPGKEQYLGHEAWHVVQQKQGRVTPTMQAKGININDDSALEREADIMGSRAMNISVAEGSSIQTVQRKSDNIVQRWKTDEIIRDKKVPWEQTKRVSTIGSKNKHVLFFYDDSEEPIVVKAGDETKEAPGLYNLETALQSSVGIKSNKMFRDDKSRNEIQDNIWYKADSSFDKLGKAIEAEEAEKAGTLKPKKQTKGLLGWIKGLGSKDKYADDLIKRKGTGIRIEAFNNNPVYVSTFVYGRSGEDFEGMKNSRDIKKPFEILTNESYMRNLGKMTVVDALMNFQDRAYSGNIGNFMIGSKGKLNAVDNVDRTMILFWQMNEDGVGDFIDKIKSDKLDEFIKKEDDPNSTDEPGLYEKIFRKIKVEAYSSDVYRSRQAEFNQLKDAYRDKAVNSLIEGVKEGKKQLAKYAQELLDNPQKLNSLIGNAQLDDWESYSESGREGKIFNYSDKFRSRLRKIIDIDKG